MRRPEGNKIGCETVLPADHPLRTGAIHRSGSGIDDGYGWDPGDQPHGNRGDCSSWDPAETELVVYPKGTGRGNVLGVGSITLDPSRV